MGICPNCGDWVDDGDICMSCGGSNASSDYDSLSDYSSGYSSSYTPPSPEKRNRIRLESDKGSYEWRLNKARKEENAMARIREYNKALDYHERYHESSKESGMKIDGMSDANHALSGSDLEWLQERHYQSQSKLALFGNAEKDELEKLLERSGNKSIILNNKSRLDAQRRANEKSYRTRHAQWLRQDYFKHIEKANDAMGENKIKKAMKEYRKADNRWREYFDFYSKYDTEKDLMPEKKFTPETVEQLMRIYVETHPLLTSKKKLVKINSEIVEMLDGKWDDEITKADRKAQEIIDERNRRKEELIKKAGEAISEVRIVGEKLIERFLK